MLLPVYQASIRRRALRALQKEYKIRVQGEPDAQEAKATESKQQGVLEERST